MTKLEEKIVEMFEKTTKGIMAQIEALLVLITGIMVSEGVSVEKVQELYTEALINAQKELGFEPIKEKDND